MPPKHGPGGSSFSDTPPALRLHRYQYGTATTVLLLRHHYFCTTTAVLLLLYWSQCFHSRVPQPRHARGNPEPSTGRNASTTVSYAAAPWTLRVEYDSACRLQGIPAHVFHPSRHSNSTIPPPWHSKLRLPRNRVPCCVLRSAYSDPPPTHALRRGVCGSSRGSRRGAASL